MPRIQKCLLLWSVLVVFVATGLGSFNWWKYLHLSTRGVRHEAIILGLFSQEHQVVTYQYEVTRHSYAGRGQSWAPNPQLEQLHAGQSVEIFYDPEHPETSVLGDPAPILFNETLAIAIAALLFPTIIVAFWVRGARVHGLQRFVT